MEKNTFKELDKLTKLLNTKEIVLDFVFQDHSYFKLNKEKTEVFQKIFMTHMLGKACVEFNTSSNIHATTDR